MGYAYTVRERTNRRTYRASTRLYRPRRGGFGTSQ